MRDSGRDGSINGYEACIDVLELRNWSRKSAPTHRCSSTV